jgi:hypothetical protein
LVSGKIVPSVPEACPSYFKQTVNQCFSMMPRDRPSAEEILKVFENIP